MMKEGWLWWGDKMVHCVGTYRPTLGKVGCVGRPLQGFQGFCILRCAQAVRGCEGSLQGSENVWVGWKRREQPETF
jgi:hypothetical protein